MTELVVRRARPDERLAIAQVHIRTWKIAYRGIVPDDFLDALDPVTREQGYSEDFLTDVERPVSVADRAGVVGFMTAGPSRDEDGAGELHAIYVDPSEWGGPAGRMLMHTATEFLEARFPFATLWVLEANQRARRFYENHGWSFDGTVKEWRFGVPEVRYRIDF